VGELSVVDHPTIANSAFYPFGVGKRVVIRLYVMHEGVDHWNDSLEARVAIWLQAEVRELGLGLRPRPYEGPICDYNAAEAAIVALYNKLFNLRFPRFSFCC